MGAENERPNYFLLLGLNPGEQWDQIHFETVLKQKQREWGKASTGIGPKATDAKQYITLLPEIERVMSDPDERENETNEARKQLADQKKARIEKFERQIQGAQRKGYLEETELQHYIKEFADVLSEQEIRSRLSVKVQTATPKRPKRPQLDSSIAGQIAEKLNALHLKTLYDLFGKASTHSRAELHKLANELYTDMVKRPPKPETTLKMELAGYAMKIFETDAKRDEYDAALEQAKINALLKDLEEIVSRTASKEVHEKQAEDFLEKAGEKGWDRAEALAELKTYANMHKWKLIEPKLSTIRQQCGFCQFINDSNSNFCQNCNRELNLNCPNCGELVAADAIGCGYCGFRVGDRFLIDDLIVVCRERIAKKNIQGAEELLSELELAWKPSNVDKRLEAIRKYRAQLDVLIKVNRQVVEGPQRQIDRNTSAAQLFGPVEGFVQGEHNTIILIFKGDKKRRIPFLVPPQPLYTLVGRSDLLHTLKQQLLVGENLALALNGLPGVGKTALAIALAYDSEVLGHFSDGILWVGLGREIDEKDKLAHLDMWGAAVGIPKSEMKKLTSLTARTKAIYNAIDRRRMLLVIDDAWRYKDALTFKLGGPNCAHVVTTRLPEIAIDFAGERIKEIHELLEEDGLALLRQFIPNVMETRPDEARELVRMVGSLPLPLILMGKFLHKQMQTGQPRRLRDALDRLRQMEERLKLAQPQVGLERHPSLPEEVPLSLLTVIKVSDEALDGEARQALRALSIFPSKPNSFSEEAALAVTGVSTRTIDVLADFGLLENSGPGRYSLHQTICDYAQYELADSTVYKRMIEYFIGYIEAHKTDYHLLEQETGNILTAREIYIKKDMSSLVKGGEALSYFIQMLRRTQVS